MNTKYQVLPYVDLTDSQTVAGVKTFSSSPIVPAPTTDLQAATKKYVDDAVTAGGGYTDELAQDAAAALFTPDDGDVDYTYNDATPSITSTIKAAAVSLAKMANVATGTIFYRKTASTGVPEVQTLATLKTDLGLTGTNSGDETASTLGATINGASAATPNNTDLVATVESSVVKKITWTNVKAFLKTYFDTLYAGVLGADDNYVTDAEKVKLSNLSGTNTGDQTTITGNAATATTLQTARNIDGQSFNGSADITVIAPGTVAATSKATPVDADVMPIADSAASNVLKKLTWANLKATLKTYLDTLYQPLDSDLTTIAGLSATTDNFIVSVASAWASRTPAQVKTTLSLNNVDNTSNATERAATATLTNKTLIATTNVVEEITTTASSSTPTPTGGSLRNFFTVTALAANATVAAPSGTPVNGNYLMMRIKDNGTARTLAFNAIFRAIGVTLPTTTVISKTMYIGCRYNSADSKWDVLAYGIEA